MLWFSRTFWRKMCSGFGFFLTNSSDQIFFPPLSTAEQNTPKEGNLALSHESNRRPRNATQKKRVLITNSPVVGTVENEIDFFSVRPFRLSATFSEYSLLVERVSRRAIVHLFKRVEFFPLFYLC